LGSLVDSFVKIWLVIDGSLLNISCLPFEIFSGSVIDFELNLQNYSIGIGVHRLEFYVINSIGLVSNEGLINLVVIPAPTVSHSPTISRSPTASFSPTPFTTLTPFPSLIPFVFFMVSEFNCYQF